MIDSKKTERDGNDRRETYLMLRVQGLRDRESFRVCSASSTLVPTPEWRKLDWGTEICELEQSM